MEESILMFIPMFFLSIFSIVIGYISSELFLGVGQDFWKDAIYLSADHFFWGDIDFIHPFIKNLPVLLSLSAMWLMIFFLYYIDFLFLYIFQELNYIFTYIHYI